MIIMTLDHVRDFVHRGAMSFSPTDLAKTSPELFFTRWITHFCAPVFMLTAGMGAFLLLQRIGSKSRLSRFLWTRGLWLVALELTAMRLAYNFNFFLTFPILLLVLWVLGACMIMLAALIHLPIRLLTVLSIAVILSHNTLDRIGPSQFGPAAWVWSVLHQPGGFPFASMVVVVGYPLVPWFAVMAAGFCFGQVFLMDAPKRRRIMLASGTIATIGFVVLRTVNMYGDPAPWSHQKSSVFTALSFLNCTKYPPSLAFLLMTLGPALLLLAYYDGRRFTTSSPLIVFGRVPLFYFILHFYVAHLAGALIALFHYGQVALTFIFNPVPSFGTPDGLYPADFGYPLWVAYAVWISIVLALYPLCRWFANVKATRRDWWLSYI